MAQCWPFRLSSGVLSEEHSANSGLCLVTVSLLPMTKKIRPAKNNSHASSFRDPAGFIFSDEQGIVHRHVNEAAAEDLALLHTSGLYDELVRKKFLVPHEQLPATKTPKDAHAILRPQQIPFVSYPFEWSFSQLKDAALLTLRIQQTALKHGMSLKDASAYNVQFVGSQPVFIDTLSFETYQDGMYWKAYRQFCQHFLAPLALMSATDVNLSQLLRVHLDGIPLGLAAKLLPRRLRWRPGLAMHLFLHARAQRAKASDHRKQQRTIPRPQLQAIIDSLVRTVSGLRPPHSTTEWGDYYSQTNYTVDAADQKAADVRAFVKPLKPKTAIDFGGNNGRYSRIFNELGATTLCTDIDPNAVEANYRHAREQKETAMLPLLVDLTNPGGGLGWANTERSPIHQRFQTDVAMALAIIHHLAISNNLPLERIAAYFSQFAPYLVIEFVPKRDSQVQKLLATREDIFPDYHEEGFEAAFGMHYELVKSKKIKGTERTLYLLKRR